MESLAEARQRQVDELEAVASMFPEPGMNFLKQFNSIRIDCALTSGEFELLEPSVLDTLKEVLETSPMPDIILENIPTLDFSVQLSQVLH